MRRVVVYGSSGAGKSALAAALVELGVAPHVEIDVLAYDDGVHVAQVVLRERFASATAGDSWVVEGMHRDQLEVAIARADVLVWIDLPRRVIAYRLAARSARHAIRRRPRHGRRVTTRSLLKREVPFIVKSIRSVPRRRAHAERLAALARQSGAEVVHVTSTAEVKTWVGGLRAR